jgi:hypothetical protein
MTNVTNTADNTNSAQAIETMKAKRAELSRLSNEVKPYVENGDFDTINEAIIYHHYQKGEHSIFKSFNQWRKDGYFIKLGSKGFPVWSRPVSALKEEQKAAGKEVAEQEDDSKTFRIAYVFSNAQVTKATEKRRASA